MKTKVKVPSSIFLTLLLFLILTSCSSKSEPSLESSITMGIVSIMDMKGNSLKSVLAGGAYTDSTFLEPLPPGRIASKVKLDRMEVDGMTVHILSPLEGSPRGSVFFLHGGAYSTSFSPGHWDLLAWLASESGYRVLAPDYPLPPAATWTASWSKVRKAWDGLVGESGNNPPVLMGDSAGGGFALALAMELAQEGQSSMAKVILLSPWLDLALDNPAIDPVEAKDPLLSRRALQICGERWADGTDLADWHLSPLHGPLGKLPRIHLFTGTADILNPDARKFQERCSQEGISLDFHGYPDMMHVWMLFDFPESKKAKKELLALLK